MDAVIYDSRPQGAVPAVPEKYRATLRRLLEASTADATRRAYRGQLQRFSDWCGENALCPLPAAPVTVAAFISFLAESGKGNATVNQALAAISAAHRAAGLESPTKNIAVQKTARGFRREFGTARHNITFQPYSRFIKKRSPILFTAGSANVFQG